jgi:hypothetical protein
MQQLEQGEISFTRSNTAAAATAVQTTNDEQGIRGGSKPEIAKAVGSEVLNYYGTWPNYY